MSLRHKLRQFAAAALCILSAPLSPRAEGKITVFAASSLQTALTEVAADFQAETDMEVSLTFASSAVLARQIAAGAPADIYFSANEDWADWVEGNVQVFERKPLLSNALELISTAPITVDEEALGGLLSTGRVAMALTEAVPAGIYGREALETLGLWDEAQAHVVELDNVRAATALVALGAADFGVVYRSDARAEAKVHTVFSFPAESHSAIRYPALRLSENEGAQRFFRYLSSDDAIAVFENLGFSSIVAP